MTLELLHDDSELDPANFNTTSPPTLLKTPLGLFEPLPIGQYVLQLWCSQPVNTSSTELSSSRETRTRVRFRPYLSHYANGLPVPKIFSRIDLDDSTPGVEGSVGKYGRSVSGDAWAGPVKTTRSKSIVDPSDYVSPFAVPPLLHSQSLPVFRTHLKEFSEKYVPPFVLNAPESFLWHVAIYRYGEHIDTSADPELSRFHWARIDPGSSQKTFTKQELCSILRDLHNLAEDDEPNWALQVKCQRTQAERREYGEMDAMRYIQGLRIEPEEEYDDDSTTSAEESTEEQSVSSPSDEYVPIAHTESHEQVSNAPYVRESRATRNFSEPAYQSPTERRWSAKTLGCNELAAKMDSPHSFSPWTIGGSLEAF